MSGKKEEFVPLKDGKVGMYVCGITAYDNSHIGHARAVVVFDVVRRHLESKGLEVTYVSNFTDVDDKIINRSAETGIPPLELSEKYIGEFFKDMDALKVKRADIYPKASEHIQDIIEMVAGLIEKGFAYEIEGSVYFSVEKVENYGKLSHRNLEDMVAGARIEVDEKKRNPMDFALWKAAKPGEISWTSPWGEGRPGWHIECSVMSMKYLGETLDIHGGGVDLVFPHHENEILQSEAYTGRDFSKYWMHNGHLTIDDEKMSKSLGNFFTVKEILDKFNPFTVRFFLLNTHYRKPLNFSDSALAESENGRKRLENTYHALKDELNSEEECDAPPAGDDEFVQGVEKAVMDFESAMDDDFNTREAIAAMFDLSRRSNAYLNGEVQKNSVKRAIDAFDSFNDILSVIDTSDPSSGEDGLSDEIERMIEERNAARANKDWAAADAIRDKLKEKGIALEDKDGKTVWKKV